MTKSYWFKIGLKALGIFLIGMVLVAGARQAVGAKHQFHTWADSLEHGSGSVALSLPMSVVPLYVSGVKVGKLDTVVVVRHEPKTIDGLRIVANLEDQTTTELANCSFALQSVENFDLQRSMVCAEDTAGLVRFGKVVFSHDGMERPLYLDGDEIEHLPWRYHSHGPDWDFEVDAPGVAVDIGSIDIDFTDMEIAIDLGDLVAELQDLADELEEFNIEIDGNMVRIQNLDRLDERINDRLRDRLQRLERVRVERAPRAP